MMGGMGGMGMMGGLKGGMMAGGGGLFKQVQAALELESFMKLEGFKKHVEFCLARHYIQV